MAFVKPESLANTGRRVFIESALGHYAMHVHGGQAHNDAKVSLWDKSTHGHQANLQWTIASGPQGFYLQSAVDPAFVAHQHGGNNDNGGPVTLWDSRTHGQQGNLQVRFEQHGEFFAIRFVHSNKCIHVHGGVAQNDAPITQWDYVEQNNLKWRITPVVLTPEYLANTGRRVSIESALGHYALHVHGGAAHNDAKITLWDKNTHGHQANLQWTIATGPQGYYLQSAVDSAFVAHQHGGNNDNGGPVTLWDARTHGQQGNLQVRFEIHGEFYAIRFVHSNKCIHVHGGVAQNDAPITQWDYVEQNNLKWRITPL